MELLCIVNRRLPGVKFIYPFRLPIKRPLSPGSRRPYAKSQPDTRLALTLASAYFTSSMMAISAASPRRAWVLMMRV